MKQVLALTVVAALAATPSAAQPSRKSEAKAARKAADHDLARQAVLRREVVPLPRILQLAGGYQPGEVIEIELEAKHGVLQYDVDVLTPGGVVHELLIDARTGKLIVNRPKAD